MWRHSGGSMLAYCGLILTNSFVRIVQSISSVQELIRIAAFSLKCIEESQYCYTYTTECQKTTINAFIVWAGLLKHSGENPFGEDPFGKEP